MIKLLKEEVMLTKKNIFILLYILIIFTILQSCNISNDGSIKYSLTGYIQKGPFINGSSITIQALDENLNPTGDSYQTTISNSVGSFSLGSEINSKYIEIIASGFYFNEVSGSLSNANITLRAISDLSISQNVNVNILTTLEIDRIKFLMSNNGKSLLEARNQAEKEILKIFNIDEPSILNFNKMDISKNGDSNAILLAISVILQGESSEAELSELISRLKIDLKEDGILDSQDDKDELKNNSFNLQLKQIRSNIENRYSNLGVVITVPNFEGFIDSDGNGIINKDDPVPILDLTYQWTKTIGGNKDDAGRSIITDQDNNIYIFGYFNDLVDFDPSSGVDSKDEITGPNGDYFITKINSNGTYGWTNILESNDRYAGINSINTDSNNNIYISGININNDMIVIKYNNSGILQWKKVMDGDGFMVKGEAIDIDSNDNIYIAGTFYGTVDFNPEIGIDNKTSHGESDIFVTKLHSDGNYEWTKTIGGPNYDFGTSIKIDLNGNIFIAGNFRGTVNFNVDGGIDNKTASVQDMFITKLNIDSSYAWTKTFQSNNGDDDLKRIQIDNNNNVYLTGAFYSQVDFDPGSNSTLKVPVGGGDIFIVKLNNDSSYCWVKTIGGKSDEKG
jgi:hypothetical protein